MNRKLCQVVRDESFATALCGVMDASGKTVRIISAGGPPLVVVRSDGRTEQLSAPGVPFGMIADASYDDHELQFASGDCLLMFTDGAIEIHNANGRILGTEGLIRILNTLGYPQSGISNEALQEALLTYSNSIRLDDDLTLLEVRFS